MSEFVWPVRIYYEDTDHGGVVYYANYLRFMERARTEYLRHYGFEQDQLSADEGVIFAVRSVELDYRRPARFNDLLAVSARIVHRGGASFTVLQEVRRNGELLCSGKVKVASLEVGTLRPVPLPQQIVTVMDSIENDH
ncbi:MAG TPA: tol-pal system-associated acyl-CoA thioesterase [Gammaproteobacteria bacterium]